MDDVDGCFQLVDGIQHGEEQVVGKEPMLCGVDHRTFGGLEAGWLDKQIVGIDAPGNSLVERAGEAVVHGIEVVEGVERNMVVEVALGTDALVGIGEAGEQQEVLVVEQKAEQIAGFHPDHCLGRHRRPVFLLGEVVVDLLQEMECCSESDSHYIARDMLPIVVVPRRYLRCESALADMRLGFDPFDLVWHRHLVAAHLVHHHNPRPCLVFSCEHHVEYGLGNLVQRPYGSNWCSRRDLEISLH